MPQVQLKLNLGIKDIILEEGGIPVEPYRKGIIYATKPLKALGKDGNDYYLKGPEKSIIIAELTAYLLANELEIPVPEFGIAKWKDKQYFASKEERYRDVEEMIQSGAIKNPDAIAQLIAFDILIANPDRNMGNLVASANMEESQDGFLIYGIDFEKSRILNPDNISQIIANPEESCWPREDLGRLLSGINYPEHSFLKRIQELTEDDKISNLFNRICDKMNLESSALKACEGFLLRRAEHIEELTRREWK